MDTMVTGSMVTYKNMSTIDKTLNTLFENTKDIDFKLYVIDNGSTDGTIEHIKVLKDENNWNMEIIEKHENVGFGAGHNIAIDKINSKYHVIINPDISLKENSIKIMTEYLENNPDIGLLSPRIIFPNGNDQILGKKNPKFKYLVASRLRKDVPGKLLREYAMLDHNLSEPIDIENATGCFMVIRTDILKKIGGFDKRYFMYFEDADITREIASVSRCVYYPYTAVEHVWGRESKRNFRLMFIHIQSMLKYFAKWNTI